VDPPPHLFSYLVLFGYEEKRIQVQQIFLVITLYTMINDRHITIEIQNDWNEKFGRKMMRLNYFCRGSDLEVHPKHLPFLLP
jgi:hypothetical protein